jgi:hypothetical protein
MPIQDVLLIACVFMPFSLFSVERLGKSQGTCLRQEKAWSDLDRVGSVGKYGPQNMDGRNWLTLDYCQ